MKKFTLSLLCIISLFIVGCSKKTNVKSIAVFVPGIMDNSPTYAMLAQGVTEAVDEFNQNKTDAEKVQLFIMEAGTNQAEWGNKILGLAASGKYDLIISSNPSLPELCEPIIAKFPKQKFLLLDATCEGNQNIATVCYNQYEQAYMSGYMAGLMSKNHKVALIAAQEYPVMNNVILPSFEKGAKAVYTETSVDFRVVGNWYDATKGAELTEAVIANGVDVVLPICGGASQGVIKTSVDKGTFVTWFDDNGFAKAPGTIVSSTTMEQVKLSKEVTQDYLNNKTVWGSAKMVGIKEGYVQFIQDDPNYIQTVPEKTRNKAAEVIQKIKAGTLVIKDL